MNCSSYFLLENKEHSIIQTVFLSCVLLFVVVINGLAIAVTVYINTSCPISRVFLSSYVGNLLGGVSLIINELIYTKKGVPKVGCQQSFDEFYFFYLGVTINMVTVVGNTYMRYQGLRSLARKPTHTKKAVFLKCTMPSWILSACIAAVLTVIQHKLNSHQFYTSLIVSVPALAVSIIWNIQLNRFLKKSRGNAEVTGQKSSRVKINNSQSMVLATIAAHTAFIAIGLLSTVVMKSRAIDALTVLICTWVLRLVYITMFSIEAKLYFYKMPCARRGFANMMKKKTIKTESSEKIRTSSMNMSPAVLTF